MHHLFKYQLDEFDDTAFVRLLKLFSASALIIILYAAIFSGFQIVDEFEHLHASWLVSIGKVPYRDFLEHHHPLLWYLSAPIVQSFYDNAIIFYVMRAISFCFSLLSTFYLYRIVLFFGNKNSAWFAIALFLGNIITFYNFYEFRPDNFMNLSFLIGIYYWFCYIKEQKRQLLVYSFLAFTISFLFLQKISFLLLETEIIILALVILRKMKFKDVMIAAIPSFALVFLFLFFIYSQGAFVEYLELNFHFNQVMISYFSKGAFWYPNAFFTIYGFTFFSALYFYKKENIYFKILSLLYIFEFLMRAYYFSPHPNYYSLLTILSAAILSHYAGIMMPKYKLICILIIFALFLNLGRLFNRLDVSSQRHNSYNHYLLADYVHKNSTADDYLMNGYDKNFNIYRKDVSYYWFGLDMLVPIIEKEYGLKHQDVNELVYQLRPKFLYTQDYIDLQLLRTYGETRYAQKFIPELITTLYNPTPFDNLMILK